MKSLCVLGLAIALYVGALSSPDHTSVAVTVTDATTGQPLPCRLTIVDQNQDPIAVSTTDQDLAVRKGVIYTGNGKARFRVESGTYRIYASRGFEYSVAGEDLAAAPDASIEKHLKLRREVPTEGLISSDTHVHTFTYSRHGDASIDERMVTLAGEGIELPIATDHNLAIDYDPVARALGVRSHFTPVIGSEVTTTRGHFNVFPIAPGASAPDHRADEWSRLFAGFRSTPGLKFAILNHPRDRHSGYRPFAVENHHSLTGENQKGWSFEAEAMEVVNSGALQSDPMQTFHDWFGLLNRGYRVTPIGSSDSHDVARIVVGQGRTYLACEDNDPGRIDVGAALKSLKAGRVFVSMGLLTRIAVDERYGPGELAPVQGSVKVAVKVYGPTWISADRVQLFANGVKIREANIPTKQPKSSVLKWEGQWVLPRPAHDLHLVAIATGPGLSAPYWRTPEPYQPARPIWEPYVIGATGAVWLDVDGNGQPSSAYDYAKRLVDERAPDWPGLFTKLAPYDEAVAIHVANLVHKRGLLETSAVRTAVERSNSAIQRGFNRFRESLARE